MNPIIDQIAPSLIRAVNSRKKPGDIDLGLGEPLRPIDLAPFEAAMAWVRENGCPYSPTAGYTELREAIAAFYGFPGMDRADNVCMTFGSEEALYLAIKTAVDPARDELLIVEPAYPAYDKICILEGIRYRTVSLSPEDGFAPRAEVVIDALRPETRAILLCSPCNPTSRVWPEAELRRLAGALATRPGPPVQVLSDEVYRHLYYTPEPPASMAQFYPHTWVMGSLSKSHALTGMRLGWLIGPTQAMPSAIKVHHLIGTSANTFAQRIGLELFRDPSSFEVHRRWYVQQREVLEAILEEQALTYVPPEGAFYTFVKLEGPLAGDSVKAAFKLIDDAHVVTVPGRAFGECSEGWLRVSWVAEPARLWEGLRRLKRGMGEID